MGVFRRVVLPTARLIVLAAIAAALLKLAFGGDADEPSSQPLKPSVELTDPQVPVTRAEITNTVSVNATISADPAVEVKATDEGEVSVILAEPGDTVEAGDALLEVVDEEAVEPLAEPNEEAEEAPAPPAPRKVYRTISAPADGTVQEYSVLVGQSVAIGDSVASIDTGRFSASGTITPEQQYRLVDAPSSARVSPQGGQSPF